MEKAMGTVCFTQPSYRCFFLTNIWCWLLTFMYLLGTGHTFDTYLLDYRSWGAGNLQPLFCHKRVYLPLEQGWCRLVCLEEFFCSHGNLTGIPHFGRDILQRCQCNLGWRCWRTTLVVQLHFEFLYRGVSQWTLELWNGSSGASFFSPL